MSDELLSEGAAQIEEGLREFIAKQPLDTYVNRSSSASRCVRERWLKRIGTIGEPTQPRMFLVWKYGHMAEDFYKQLVKMFCVGPEKLYSEVDFGTPIRSFMVDSIEVLQYEQPTVYTKITDKLTVTGHVDGWGKRNADDKWEVMDFKTASNYGYDKFVAGEIPEYIYQMASLLLSDKAKELGAESSRLWYWRKETEHLHDKPFPFLKNDIEKVRREFIVAASEPEPAPPYELEQEKTYNRSTKQYDPTGRMIIPNYPCGYCAYKAHCYSEVQLEFKSGKPVWVYRPKKVSGNE